jgi:hypothetical protein
MKNSKANLKAIVFALIGVMAVRYLAKGTLSDELIIFSVVYFGCIIEQRTKQ